MGKVQINGKTYNIPEGARVDILNNKVLVDGQVLPSDDVQISEIVITGNTGPIRTDASVRVDGTIVGNVSAKGSVQCDDIKGDVEAGGSVHAKDISGNVSAKGSVLAERIGS